MREMENVRREGKMNLGCHILHAMETRTRRLLSIVGKFPWQVEAEIRNLNNDNLLQSLLNLNGKKEPRVNRRLRDVHISYGRVWTV